VTRLRVRKATYSDVGAMAKMLSRAFMTIRQRDGSFPMIRLAKTV
jgi:hypothetical protein